MTVEVTSASPATGSSGAAFTGNAVDGYTYNVGTVVAGNSTRVSLVFTGSNLPSALGLVPTGFESGDPFSAPDFGGGLTVSSGVSTLNYTIAFTPRTAGGFEATFPFTGGGLAAGITFTLTGTGVAYPFMADGDGTLQINTINDLNAIRTNLSGNYRLTKDLDFANADSYAGSTIIDAYRPQNDGGVIQDNPADGENVGFAPIGTSVSNNFRGTFRGDGFTISNLYVNAASGVHAGLFGYAAVATIENVGVLDAFVRSAGGSSSVGALLGGVFDVSVVQGSYATGTVTMSASNQPNVGGLVGTLGTLGTP